ncbi:MAG: 2-hydroxyacyl-CoA dehydratase [Candidatus Tectomicrobia bacterium]|uniref:2-hydroxyacyl-CoA dehydratase n=1 Tax=Tectimicrobiota bacterium TaxID=2528274 RepID=A0A932FVV8_UNCTE|nr:2-hydroxyacyl-CoA dehydratase [Candidatus Tectomicrobia bacterium]
MDTVKASVMGFSNRLRHRKTHPGGERTGELFYEVMLKYYQMLDQAREEGKPIVWVGMAPTEIFYAMDIMPFFPEFHCMVVATQADPAPYFDTAAGYGLPVEICSVHRVMTGMDIMRELPAPDLVVHQAYVCASGLKFYGSRNEYHGCPSYMLDAPYRRDADALRYYARELEGLVAFLEEQTGRKLDRDRLDEAMQRSHEAFQCFYEIGELRKAVPTPLRAREAFRNFSVYESLMGRPEGADYFRTLRDEVKARVERGQGAVSQENFRLGWLYVPPNYALGVFDWMEVEYGASIPMDIFNFLADFEWDPSRPFETLARKSFNSLLLRELGGPVENATREAVRMVREYQLEGAVFFTQIGCKQGCGVLRCLKDALQAEAGVPLLIIDGDVVDPSIMPVEELKTKLEGFFELLEERR